MSLQRAHTIDALYEQVADYDLVLTTDAPLSLAVNRRITQPRLGTFAATPRMLASGEFRPRDERQLFLELIDATDLSWKHAAYLLENILSCWDETGDLHAILEYDQFDTPATRRAIEIIETTESAHRDLADYNISEDTTVAVIGEDQFTTLDKTILPTDYDVIDPFAAGEFDLPEFRIFDSTTAIVDAVVDNVTPETADDVGIIMDRGSEYPALIESAFEANDIPFYGGPGFADDEGIRTSLRLLRTAHADTRARLSDVRPILAHLGIRPSIEDDQKYLHNLDQPDVEPLQRFCESVGERTFDEALTTFEEWCGRALDAFRDELAHLGVLDAPVTDAALDDLEFYLQSFDVPVDRDESGVLLADATAAAYVDRPVVFYLGMDVGWTHRILNRPWIDADAKDRQYLRQFQLLLQNGRDQYYLVQETTAGQPVTPCLYFHDLLDDDFDTFGDLPNVPHTRVIRVVEIEDSTSGNNALDQIFNEVQHGDIDIAQDIGSQILESQIPQFLYMGEYHFLEDEISMNQLVKKQNQNELKEGDEIFLSLLSISNLEATELRDNDDWARIRTDLEAAANDVTDYVLDYWSQNQNIRFQFDRNYLPEGTSFRWQNERVVEILVENLDYRATIPFNQQSRGFRWFFSVFCQFTDLKNQDKDLLVLLDEPGLHLHARAQQDFLDFLNDELSPQYPVVYTTHSPFMIDPRRLHRAKMVVSDPGRGTNISDDVMRIGEDTRLPLQNVFEFDLVDTLLIRPQTLLVEGKSDHSYIYTMSEILDERDRTSLDRKWTVIPVGSGSNVPTFVSLFGGNDLDLAVLLDADNYVHQRVDNIESRGVMDTDNIRDTSDFTDEDHGDIEDLFSTDFYMELVNRAYSGELAQVPDIPDYISTSDFKEDNRHPRIAKRLDTFFERFHINEGNFEHNKPAKYFQDHRGRLKDELDEESIENFETMFEDFNEILQEIESPETTS